MGSFGGWEAAGLCRDQRGKGDLPHQPLRGGAVGANTQQQPHPGLRGWEWRQGKWQQCRAPAGHTCYKGWDFTWTLSTGVSSAKAGTPVSLSLGRCSSATLGKVDWTVGKTKSKTCIYVLNTSSKSASRFLSFVTRILRHINAHHFSHNVSSVSYSVQSESSSFSFFRRYFSSVETLISPPSGQLFYIPLKSSIGMVTIPKYSCQNSSKLSGYVASTSKMFCHWDVRSIFFRFCGECLWDTDDQLEWDLGNVLFRTCFLGLMLPLCSQLGLQSLGGWYV